jgi:hypothetical protein
MATTITTFKKSQIGVEDIHFDSAGSASTANTPTSNGGTRQVRKINASHIPATTATRAKTDAAGTTLDETNVDTILQQLLDDNAAQGIPDGVTLQVVAGVLSILSVGNAALATDSVDTPQIVDDAVVAAKIVDLAVTAAKLAANAVTTAKITDANVTEAKLATGAVTKDKVADDAVDINSLDMDGSGAAPAMFPVATGTSSVAAAATINVVDAACTTGCVILLMQTSAPSPTAYLITTVANAGSFDVTWNTSTTCNFSYVIFKPTSV